MKNKTNFFFFFIIFLILGRILFPFGDEPDFGFRAEDLVDKEHYVWSPYNLTSNILQKIDIHSNCKIDADAFSVWSHIDSESCTQSIDQVFFRVLLTLFVISPILLIIIYKKSIFTLLSKFHSSISESEWNLRIEAIILTLMFPSVIYYTGILAEEQFILILSFLVFIFWRIWWIILPVTIIIALIDFGNFIVVASFIISLLLLNFLNNHIKLRSTLIVATVFITLIFIMSSFTLNYLASFDLLSGKAIAMTELLEEGDYRNKYPVLLRPVITFMSSIFMLPSGIKVAPLYILYFALIVATLLKIRKRYRLIKKQKENRKQKIQSFNNSILFLASPIAVVLLFVFIAPNYSFAKYYIFTIPFIVYFYISNFGSSNVAKLFIFSTLFTFLNLLLFRI